MSDPTQNAAPKVKTTKPGLPPSSDATAAAARETAAPLVTMLDHGLARARDTHEKMIEMLETTTEALEEAFSSANRGSAEYRTKMMEMARANTNVAFDMMRELMAAKSLPEWMELSTAHARKQFEIAVAQFKELSDLTQKVANDTAAPLRSSISEPFRQAG